MERQVYRTGGKLTVAPPKTKTSARSLLIPNALLDVLNDMHSHTASEWMFPSPVKPDSPLDPASVRKRIRTILDHAGCSKLRFHDLRHTFATLSLEAGMDVKTLSAIIGTSTPTSPTPCVPRPPRPLTAPSPAALHQYPPLSRKSPPSPSAPTRASAANPAPAASPKSTNTATKANTPLDKVHKNRLCPYLRRVREKAGSPDCPSQTGGGEDEKGDEGGE